MRAVHRKFSYGFYSLCMTESNVKTILDRIDHLAIVVDDLNTTLDWYLQKFNCSVLYKDATWAMIEFANIKLAFVVAQEHPRHLCVERKDATSFGSLKTHRDGSRSCYIEDPSKNILEILESVET